MAYNLISRNRQTSIVISHTQSSQRPKKAWHLVRITSNNKIPLLKLVTFATSHRLRSPLKAEVEENTIARKEGRLHLQSTRKKRRRKEEPWSKSNIRHQPKPPSEPPWITHHKSMFRSRYGILKHRLDVMHAGDTRIRKLSLVLTLSCMLLHHLLATNP
jgi:hypothetical protein